MRNFLEVFRNIVLLFPFSKFNTVRFSNLFIDIIGEFKEESNSKYGSSFEGISIRSE